MRPSDNSLAHHIGRQAVVPRRNGSGDQSTTSRGLVDWWLAKQFSSLLFSIRLFFLLDMNGAVYWVYLF